MSKAKVKCIAQREIPVTSALDIRTVSNFQGRKSVKVVPLLAIENE